MAIKRAKTDAVCAVPLVSELFVPDEDDEEDDDAPAPKAKAQPKQQAQKPQPQTPAVPVSVKRAVELAEKLVMNHDIDPESLATKFLPEGVANFDSLTEQQAAAIVPKLAEFLNAQGGK
jgi:pyruvate/2-oxoglutarate dehydrogenase complex dihydrolipoamide acyltransferase (E2) component